MCSFGSNKFTPCLSLRKVNWILRVRMAVRRDSWTLCTWETKPLELQGGSSFLSHTGVANAIAPLLCHPAREVFGRDSLQLLQSILQTLEFACQVTLFVFERNNPPEFSWKFEINQSCFRDELKRTCNAVFERGHYLFDVSLVGWIVPAILWLVFC